MADVYAPITDARLAAIVSHRSAGYMPSGAVPFDDVVAMAEELQEFRAARRSSSPLDADALAERLQSRLLPALVDSLRAMLGPQQRTPPSTSDHPGLKQETLGEAPDYAAPAARRYAQELSAIDSMLSAAGVPSMVPAPNGGTSNLTRHRVLALIDAHQGAASRAVPRSNEMVANATRERLRNEVERLGQGIAAPPTGKAEVMRLADQLHALAVGGASRQPDSEEFVYWARTSRGGSMPKRTALSSLTGDELARVRRCVDGNLWLPRVTQGLKNTDVEWDVEPAPTTYASPEVIARAADVVRPPLPTEEPARSLETADRARRVNDILAGETMAPRSNDRLARLEAVATAARDMHLGVEGAQQRLEDALKALDVVR